MTKQFDVNPATSFISSAAPAGIPGTPGKPPKGFKINPEYLETKSKKLQCLIKPSDFERLKAEAGRRATSVNSLVNEAIERFLGVGE